MGWARRTARRVGRRRAALGCLALVVGLVGYSLLTVPPAAAAQPGLRVLKVVPLAAWGWTWVAVAVVCAAAAVRRPYGSLGFGLPAALFGTWGGGYLAAWLVYAAPRGWVAATVYFAQAGMIAFLAGPDHPPPGLPP